MANDDISLNTATAPPIQGTTSPGDANVSSVSQPKSPRVDAGDSGTNPVYGGQTTNDGPVLSLPNTMPASVMTELLMSLQQKVSSERIKDAKEEIKAQTTKAQQKDQKRIDDIKKAMKAREKAKHHSKLGKIFGWIGVALTYVAAAVVTVASGGAAAAPVLAAAVLMTGLMIAQETGGMDKLAKAMHLGKKGEMGLMIGLTAAILVVSLVGVVASGGTAAVSMVSSLASAVSRATATGAEIGASAADMTAAGAETGSAVADISAEATEGATESIEMSANAGEIASSASDAGDAVEETSFSTSEAESEVSEASSEASEASSETSEASEEVSDDDKGQEIVEKSATRTQRVAARVGNMVNVSSAGTSVGGGIEGVQTAEAEHDASMADADATDQQAFLAQIQALQAATISKLKKILEDMQANASTIFSIASSANKLTEEITKGSSA